ncbi:hypothetical protein QBC45DRAFT_416215 [Copromyces sp. CBS 386.78]|nr:hypothetical protein QBC45DRAFT_416215 [Copromyces sp. CBS 386.78]
MLSTVRNNAVRRNFGLGQAPCLSSMITTTATSSRVVCLSANPRTQQWHARRAYRTTQALEARKSAAGQMMMEAMGILQAVGKATDSTTTEAKPRKTRTPKAKPAAEDVDGAKEAVAETQQESEPPKRKRGRPKKVVPETTEDKKVVPETTEDKKVVPETTEDGKAEDKKVVPETTEDGKVEDGKVEDGKAEDGKVEDGKAQDGKAQDGKAEDGKETEEKPKKRKARLSKYDPKNPDGVVAAKPAKEKPAKEESATAKKTTKKKKKSSLKPAKVTRTDEQSMLRPCVDPVQEKLYDTELWGWLDYGRSSARGPSRPGFRKYDRTRVHVTSEKMIDDILEYMKPTLMRHEGCDIIDLNPGAGVWSTKLNDLLKPRTHLLLEPDAEFYAPMLEPLLEREGIKLIAKDGVIWAELLSVLTPEYLPHQKEHHYTADDVPERNDTLLVTANLGSYPKRKYASFASATAMILYQFNHAIRSGALFQKYGLVRMLLWLDDEDKAAILPRMAQRRRRVAVDAELNCESITHVAGPDYSDIDPSKRLWFSRDVNIDRSSALETLQRMKKAGIQTPPGRETKILREISENPAQVASAGEVPITYDFRHQDQLDQLEQDFEEGKIAIGSDEHKLMVRMRVQIGSANRRFLINHKVMETFTQLINDWRAAKAAGGDNEEALAAIMARYKAWEKAFLNMGTTANGDWFVQRDNLHLWSQKSMLWDRRAVEPLVVNKEEFFPHVPLSLLDIQPKAAHRVLRSMGPNSDRSGDMADVLMRSIMIYINSPMSKVLNRLAPGAADYVYPKCQSFVDPEKGGVPFPGTAEITVRGMSAWQYEDLLEQWMKWPFKPKLEDLISQLSDEYKEAEEDGGKFGGVSPEF